MKYKLFKDIITNETNLVLRTDDNGIKSYVPIDEANTDYQAYLEWKADGNEPEAAD